MRKRRFFIVFILSFVCFALFYLSLLRERFFLSSLDVIPTQDFSHLRNATPTKVDDGCVLGDSLYENYCAFTPFREEQRDVKELGYVTLCTQGTFEFLHHVTVLCNRWGGPISVAVYSPPEDYPDARNLVDSLRQCDFCVRHWVSWHFFFRKSETPLYTPGDAIINCSSVTAKERKKRFQDTYPINVGRNLARNKTHTPYVFSIDIELYPSSGILSKFERMLRTTVVDDKPQVWVMPVFEVDSNYRAPTSKFKLRSMYSMKQAISFHKYRCNICHRIPNLTEWLNHETSKKSEVMESLEQMKVFITIKRSRKQNLQEWEPFFIGTKSDPEFDIRLSWEGKENKMQMAYEMCMKDYNFHIVSNAFLVHTPGINVYNATKEKYRMKHQVKNRKWISIIKKELKKKYGTKDC